MHKRSMITLSREKQQNVVIQQLKINCIGQLSQVNKQQYNYSLLSAEVVLREMLILMVFFSNSRFNFSIVLLSDIHTFNLNFTLYKCTYLCLTCSKIWLLQNDAVLFFLLELLAFSFLLQKALFQQGVHCFIKFRNTELICNELTVQY